MRTKLISKGKRFFAPTLAAIIAVAITFTLTSCARTMSAEQKQRVEEMKQDMIAIEAARDSLKAIYKQDTVIAVKIRDREYKITINDRLDTLKTMYKQDTVVMAKIGDKEYKTILIGSVVWMAENLNIEVGNSICYDNKEENCNQCGRLYDRETAFKACPEGWYYTSKSNWKLLAEGKGETAERTEGVMMRMAGEKSKSGILDNIKAVYSGLDGGADLKSKSGWDNNGNGSDKYGFSVLPCGARYHEREICAPIKGKMTCTGKNKDYFGGYGSSASFWISGNGPLVGVTKDGRQGFITYSADYMELNSNSDKLRERDDSRGDIMSMFSVRCSKQISEDLQFIPKKVETQANPQEAIAEPEEAQPQEGE
ncbi:MAG: hypothetical protein LBH25_01835 [Fibromonadaceae bacterium]|jgi:uncharacterized protein (TIGR02145 family)|nr:hypothetical protein [Fibromonadaceae bacterium]